MKTWDEVVEGYRQRFIEYFSKGDVPGFSEQACREMMYVLEYQKTGKWIDTGSGTECSECHEIMYGYDNYRNYCQYCGSYNGGEK